MRLPKHNDAIHAGIVNERSVDSLGGFGRVVIGCDTVRREIPLAAGNIRFRNELNVCLFELDEYALFAMRRCWIRCCLIAQWQQRMEY